MRRSRRKSRRWFAAEEGTLPSSLDPRRCSFSSPDVAAEEASSPPSSSGRRRNRRASSSRAGDPSRSSPPRSLHPRGRDGRTRLPKAVLGGSSPLASFRSFRGGARRPNAPAAPKTFLTLRGTPSRDGDGSEGAWIAAVAASRRALRSFRRRFACAVEGKRRGEGEGSGVGGEGGRRGERVRARTGGGGGGESLSGAIPGRAPKRAPGARLGSAPGAPRGGRTASSSARARALACSSNFRRRRFVSATCWRRARSRASIIIPPLGPADVGERSARAVARKSNAGTDARARSKINGGARVDAAGESSFVRRPRRW